MTLPQSPLVWSLGLSLLWLFALALVSIVAAVRAGGRREETITADDTRAASRFTIPVSVLVTTTAADDEASRTIAAVLDLNYPELEVIVVVNGQQRAGVDTLIRDWLLEAHEFFFRRSIDTTPVTRMYRSGRDSRLTVVDQRFTSVAEAMNCGVNLARYRYIAVVEPGLTFDRNALLRIMAAPLRDPSSIVGTSAHIERTGAFSRLASVRSLVASLLVWQHLPSAPGPADAVYVWRRDALLDVGGFATTSNDPELDMTMRILLDDTQPKQARFYRSGELFGQRADRRGGAVRRVWAVAGLWRAWTPGGLRAFGLRSVATFFALELITPVAQAVALLASVLHAMLGDGNWTTVCLVVTLLAIGRAAVTTGALLTRGSSLAPPEGAQLRRLLASAPFELLGRR